jgi:hypothetical protein
MVLKFKLGIVVLQIGHIEFYYEVSQLNKHLMWYLCPHASIFLAINNSSWQIEQISSAWSSASGTLGNISSKLYSIQQNFLYAV